MRRLCFCCAPVLLILLASAPLWAAEAYTVEVSGVSYDEECLVYCLQGIVNREAPRLFLDTASLFWQWPPSDQYWLQYLAEKKSFHFTKLDSLRAAIDHFRPELKGLVLYDPARDGSRYVALTMAAQRNLLPVTEAILRYETQGLSAGARWTEDDMREPHVWRPTWTALERVAEGLRLHDPDPAWHYGLIDRTVELDLARTPLLEIEVKACTGRWALKVNGGTPVDVMLQGETSAVGLFRSDLRSVLKRPQGRVLVRIFTVGDGSSVTVGRLRLLSAEGQPVPPVAGGSIDCFRGLSVAEDLRGRFADDLAAQRWALDHLMPGCTRKLAFSAGHTHEDSDLGGDPGITIGLDYPIAQRAFIFNLSPRGGPPDAPGKPGPDYAGQTQLFDEVLRRLDRPAGIYGWSEPENLYAERVSRDGCFVMCAAAPNLSFWAKVPVGAPPRLTRGPERRKPVENKYYLVFQTNEGDTPKIVAGLMGGAWVSEQRGTVPVAWGINPLIAEAFPALFEFYARTATPNDTFFAGVSGAGYCFPWHMPNTEDFARQTGRCLAETGVKVVDVWESTVRLDLFQRYRQLFGAAAFTQQTGGGARNEWLEDGTPLACTDGALFYYNLDAKDSAGDLQRRIERVAAAHEPPFFILCYGGIGPGLFGLIADTQKRLAPDRFEVIGADDFAALGRQAGQLTVAFDGLGVSPGGKVNLEVALRNADGAAGRAGAVEWTLPPGWGASEPRWEHGPVAPGKTLRHTVALTAGAGAGRVRATCTDARTGATRTAAIDVYTATELVSEFREVDGWREAGATLKVADGVGTITTPGQFAAIRKTVAIDFDREPLIEINVKSVGGQWALKVNDGTLPQDINLQTDTSLTGRHCYDLARLADWHGRKTLDLILFAVGAGTSVQVGDIEVHYRK